MVADEALLQGVERRRADIPEHHAQRPQCQERQLLLRMAVAHPLTRSIRHPHRTRCCRGGNSEYRSEEHTSELQSLMRISYAVFSLKKKNKINKQPDPESNAI